MLYAFFGLCILVVVGLIALDLGLFHRRGHEHIVKMREAVTWSCVWVSLALTFNVVVYFLYGHNWLGFRDVYGEWLGEPVGLSGMDAAVVFLNGYLLELSLSMDNLFVFAAILGYFRVPLGQQHRVLVWGILGAIFLRGVMIALGAVLVETFDWIFYAFGVLLIWTAWKMLKSEEGDIQPESNIFIRMARKVFPVTAELHGHKFFVRLPHPEVSAALLRMERGESRADEPIEYVQDAWRKTILHMTPLFLALILVDIADVMFAVDSIPAIFGITQDTFIVFTSNMFAVMGLRSMYFALINLMHKFRFLKHAIVGLLAYIGVKMLLHDVLHIPNLISLAVIFGFLATGVIASLMLPKAHVETEAKSPPSQ